MEKNINGVWVGVDSNDMPTKESGYELINGQYRLKQPATSSPVAVADQPVAAAVNQPVAAIKTISAIRDLYCQSVFNAWCAYDLEVRRIYQSYTDAFELGRVEKDDKTFNWKNTSLVKAWSNRDEILKNLWIKYKSCEPGQSELKAVIIRAVKVQPSVYIPQTDAGSYLVKRISTHKSHDCYVEVEEWLKTFGLSYTLKMHNGFLVLISDDDELQSKLFTVSPLEYNRVVN